MISILMNHLKDCNITSVYSVECIYGKGLNCIEVCYIKDGYYYKVRSYTNNLWLSNRPSGPIKGIEGFVMETLYDVAEIIRSETDDIWKKPFIMTEDTLNDLLKGLEDKAFKEVKNILYEYSDLIYNVSISYSPSFCINILLAEKDKINGILSWQTNGEVSVLMGDNRTVQDIANKLTGKWLIGEVL